jgi:hypothetical protein
MRSGRLAAVAAVVAVVAVVGSTACRKEVIALDGGGGGPSTVEASGAAGGDSGALRKDRSEAASQERFVVRMERSACYGLCPAYAVELGADGAVGYEGKAFVSVRGHASSHVSHASASALESRFEQAGFFRLEWRDPCDAVSTDSPTTTLTFVHAGRKRTISDYRGNGCMPKVLRELEDEVDRVLGTARWVACDGGYCER